MIHELDESERRNLFTASCQNHLLNKYPPAQSEYESIGRHTLNAKERGEQLKQLLNDDLNQISARDPCIEVETIVRVPRAKTKYLDTPVRKDSAQSQNGIKSILKKPVMMEDVRIPISVKPRRKIDVGKMKKLSKSTMELTTVVNNETVVSSSPAGGVPNSQFLVFYPNDKMYSKQNYVNEVSWIKNLIKIKVKKREIR
jgi:hypothetical protein